MTTTTHKMVNIKNHTSKEPTYQNTVGCMVDAVTQEKNVQKGEMDTRKQQPLKISLEVQFVFAHHVLEKKEQVVI